MPRTPREGRRPDPDATERIPLPPTGHRDRYDDHDRYDDDRAGYAAHDRYDDHDPYDDDRAGYAAHDRYDDGGRYNDGDRAGGAGRSATPGPRRRRPRYGVRRVVALLALGLVAYLVAMIVVVAQVWGSVNRIDASPDVADRPVGARGANYLLVGTDSREALTEEQRGEFGTGFTEGHRADTVMLLHVPTFGEPTLVSLPRDSYVEIRDGGWNKLNAAHANGGPEQLVDTVERATGLPVDGYLEIGFGGFVDVVNGVGGVEMCLDEPIADEKAHIDLPAGCQELAGEQALGYVRMRYSDPRGDLGRVERQREFLAALVDKMLTPATVLVPWRLHEVGTATGSSLSLGEDTSMLEAGRMAWAMRQVAAGEGISVTVPTADPNYQTPVGSAVLWDEQRAGQLFSALRQGQPITVEP